MPMILCQGVFHLGIRLRGGRMSPQVISKQEGIALIGPSREPDMEIGWTLNGGRLKHPLHPVAWLTHTPRWEMVSGEVFKARVASPIEGKLNRWGKVLYGDLNVDPILCRQTGNGSRTNMIDTQRQITQHLAQDSTQC